MTPPRPVASWDDYFMSLAAGVAQRSKDPHTQHGAIVVSDTNLILGTGYNGGCRNIDDDQIDWSRPAKYKYIIHAEENALWVASNRLIDNPFCALFTLYVTGQPCSRCMLRICHVGIGRVVYGLKVSASVDDKDWTISRHIAELAGVDLINWGEQDE